MVSPHVYPYLQTDVFDTHIAGICFETEGRSIEVNSGLFQGLTFTSLIFTPYGSHQKK